MKQYYFKLAGMMLFIGAIMQACNTAPDSKKAAEESNEEKFSKRDTIAGPSSNVLEKDADFAVAAADGGRMEVELGNLAQSNAGSQNVKDFGMMMVQDHSKANDELKSLAAEKGITLPDSLSNEKKKKYEELSSLTGNRFDKKYMSFMVSDHKEDIDQFRKYADNGANADLMQWASDKLPVLELHLQHARQIDSTIKKSR
ncbi:DUF4142 domain-containing protein [Niabella aquatica]